MLDVEALDAIYRERVLNQFGIGVPFAYGVVGAALFVGAAPGIDSFAAQNAYARVGIVLMSALGALALVAAGYDLRRLDPSRWKLTAERDGPGAGADADVEVGDGE